MKILMIYADKFAYKTKIKTLIEFPDVDGQENITKALVGFIHVEEKDADDLAKSVTKLIKNLKWAANKNNTRKIILHSFAHLSNSSALPEITKAMLNAAEERLLNADFEVSQTPFGYFLDLNLEAPGDSLARIFKEF